MKVKTSELSGFKLDLAVAKAEGEQAELNHGEVVTWKTIAYQEYRLVWRPSTEWAQGGPIIEREGISLEYLPGAALAGMDTWVATRADGPAVSEEQGPTPLIAAMRAYVASQLGDEVELNEMEEA